ncbi:MAG TPA: hypothetical protein PK959_17925, partial [Candidatus Competibacteraceae bacterium]|nr:hypothetical protein [Candidatus Competibacteraceae bacterium]
MRSGPLPIPFLFVAFCLLALGFVTTPARSAEPTVTASALARVPPALQPWISWVLREPADWRC